jgi:hypothetical protein
MKVIGAGFGRTATLSLKAALERLGFDSCYHMVELPKQGHGPFWKEAARKRARGEPVDWDAVFGDYRATVDFPGADFYAELVEAYPEAKSKTVFHYFRAWRIDGTWERMNRVM